MYKSLKEKEVKLNRRVLKTKNKPVSISTDNFSDL